MANGDSQQYQTIKHPTLGTMRFPAGMPDDEIGKVISNAELAERSSQPTQFEKERTPQGSAVSRFAKSTGSAALGLAKGAVDQFGTALAGPTAAASQAIKAGTQFAIDDALREQQGRSTGYRVAAGLGSLAGVDATAMEQAADRGDMAGILGQAAVPTALAVGTAARGPLSRAAKGVLEKVKATSEAGAAGLTNKLLRPRDADFSFGKNPGSVAKEGIVAGSKQGYLDKIRDLRTQEVGPQIDSTLAAPQNAAKQIDVGSSVDKIFSEAMSKAGRSGEQAYLNRINDLRRSVYEVLDADPQSGQIVSKGTRNLRGLSPTEATELKRSIGENTKWTGQAFDKEANQVRVKLYGALKDSINRQVPEVAGLNERYSNLLGAEKSLERQVRQDARSSPFNLRTVADVGGILGTGTIPGVGALGAADLALRGVTRTGLGNTLAAQALRLPARMINLAPGVPPNIRTVPFASPSIAPGLPLLVGRGLPIPLPTLNQRSVFEQ